LCIVRGGETHYGIDSAIDSAILPRKLGRLVTHGQVRRWLAWHLRVACAPLISDSRVYSRYPKQSLCEDDLSYWLGQLVTALFSTARVNELYIFCDCSAKYLRGLVTEIQKNYRSLGYSKSMINCHLHMCKLRCILRPFRTCYGYT
jgi:hypothetical protein